MLLGAAILNRVIREILTEKLMSRPRPEGGLVQMSGAEACLARKGA